MATFNYFRLSVALSISIYRTYVLILSMTMIHVYGFSQQDTVISDSVLDTAQIHLDIKRIEEVLDSLKQLINSEITVDKDSTIPSHNWNIKLSGILGFDFNQFNNWVGRGNDSNSSSAVVSGTLFGQAEVREENLFWINKLNIALGWQRFDNGLQALEIQRTVDLFNLSTHLGTNLSERLALSMFGEWRTQLINATTAPSYLDMSLGLTWTPNSFFMMTLHPVNYELVLSNRDQFLSSLGAKVALNYERNITDKLSVRSYFNSFISYRNFDLLSNHTWTNGINI